MFCSASLISLGTRRETAVATWRLEEARLATTLSTLCRHLVTYCLRLCCVRARVG